MGRRREASAGNFLSGASPPEFVLRLAWSFDSSAKQKNQKQFDKQPLII